MTTATLLGLMAVGFVTGLVAQFGIVHFDLTPRHDPRGYLVTGLIGAVGALLIVPVMMLAEYGRTSGASFAVVEPINPLAGVVGAANALILWLIFTCFRRAFWSVVTLVLAGIATIVLVVSVAASLLRQYSAWP